MKPVLAQSKLILYFVEKCEGMGLKIVGAVWDLSAKSIDKPIANLGGNGPDRLNYLAGKSQTAPTIFSFFSWNKTIH